MKFLKSLILLLSMCFASAALADDRIELTPQNTVVLRGEVTGESVAKVEHDILTNPNKHLYLFINSPGGSIQDGLRLVALLHGTDKQVDCITNFAASMAFAILQSCNKRYVTEDAVVMQHVASYELKGQEPNNWSMANFVHRMVTKMAKMQAARIGITYDKFVSLTRGDWWLFDGEAVEQHVADAQVTAVCSAEMAKGTNKQVFRSLFGSAEVTWSNCPLIDGPLEVKALNAAPIVGGKPNQLLDSINSILDWRGAFMRMYNGDTTVQRPKEY